jgi:thioredoxin reductase/2-polyprenyl-3-methyl-5-hydroxy-6-metoxy-1,4-benzoquinol methylase
MTYDVVVIGGGAAGLSAALMLVRSRRSVVVIDGGQPRNAPADGVHGFLTRDGMPPRDLVAAGRAEVAGYGGQFIDGTVTAVRPGFEVDVDGRTVTARRLIVATGVTDDLPPVPGLRERWGRDVVHCPYCHGWEVRDQVIGVLGTGEMAVHQALLFRQLSEEVILLRHTAPPLTFEQSLQVAARGIRVVAGTVTGLDIADDRLVGARLADGTTVALQALAVSSRLRASTAAFEPLGLAAVEHPMGIGTYLPADPTGKTAVPGVWVAGNVTDPMAQVVMVAAAGARAGAMVNADLVAEEATEAAARHDFFTEEFWDERYRSAERIWSGNPNPHLVASVADLPPGQALDVGAGEGADAVWLASRGWTVTGVDVSGVALDKAAAHARDAGVDVTWERADVRNWDPAPRRYDLVTAQFMQFPGPVLDTLHRRLAAAVRPGGTLLIVGHHPADHDKHHLHHLMFTAHDAAASLDPTEWDVSQTSPQREIKDSDGNVTTARDAVLRAVRRQAASPRSDP